MSSGIGDRNMYTLFQAISLVLGTAALFYTLKGLAGPEGASILSRELTKMAQNMVSGVIEAAFYLVG